MHDLTTYDKSLYIDYKTESPKSYVYQALILATSKSKYRKSEFHLANVPGVLFINSLSIFGF